MKQPHKTPVMSNVAGLLRRHVAALFDDRRNAERAMQALVGAGFDGTEIHFLEQQDLGRDAGHSGSGLLASIRSIVFWDERAAVTNYLRALKCQRVLMLVPADGDVQIGQVRALASQFGTHSVRYYGTWTIQKQGKGSSYRSVPVPVRRSAAVEARLYSSCLPTAA